jgi:hypothetical protein
MTAFEEPSLSESYHYSISQPTPQRAQPARPDGSAHTYSYGSVSRPYVARGWIEQALPHGTKYFVNPHVQATADVDLRNLTKLEAVMSVVEAAGSAPEGCEMWVRDGPAAKKAGGPVISWVDHRIRRVSSEISSIDGIIFSGEDDSQWYFFSYTLPSNEKTQDLMRSIDTGHSSSVTLRIFHYRQVLSKKL